MNRLSEGIVQLREKIIYQYQIRPWWMNGLLLFCLYMTFVYMPFDMFIKPVANDKEVWFGYLFTGWAAKATEPFHWAIYGAGAYGFLKMKTWMWPWASLYVCQVAFSMLVWSLFNERVDERISSVMMGILVASPFIVLAVALWRAKNKFEC